MKNSNKSLRYNINKKQLLKWKKKIRGSYKHKERAEISTKRY